MRKVELKKGNLLLKESDILGFIEGKVTPVGNSAKVSCPRRFLGRRAYLIICKRKLGSVNSKHKTKKKRQK